MSSPTLVVRRISGVDLRQAVELLAHARSARGGSDSDALRPAVQAALEDSDHVLALGAYHEGLPGFQHGKMVGVLVMTVLISVEHAGEMGWIEELFVREDYRRRGLGDQLLGQALAWAQARGMRALDLELRDTDPPTDGVHSPATELLGRHGFRRFERARLQRTLEATKS